MTWPRKWLNQENDLTKKMTWPRKWLDQENDLKKNQLIQKSNLTIKMTTRIYTMIDTVNYPREYNFK